MAGEIQVPEGLVVGDDFSLIRVETTYQNILGILAGFRTDEKYRLAIPPLLDWHWLEVQSLDEGVRELELWGNWSEEGVLLPENEYRIGILKFVQINKYFANIYGERDTQTADGAAVFDAMWDYLQQSLGLSNSPQKNSSTRARGPNIDTVHKLRILANLREEDMNTRGEIPTWSVACQLASVDPKTVRRHVPLLRQRWKDSSFRLEDIEEFISSLENS